jgi:hypothetical protein
VDANLANILTTRGEEDRDRSVLVEPMTSFPREVMSIACDDLRVDPAGTAVLTGVSTRCCGCRSTRARELHHGPNVFPQPLGGGSWPWRTRSPSPCDGGRMRSSGRLRPVLANTQGNDGDPSPLRGTCPTALTVRAQTLQVSRMGFDALSVKCI